MTKENSSKQNNLAKGFTLLELLVVVLIIGILTAIALPKYKTAVNLSKVRTFIGVMKTIYDARERYYLINNQYTDNLDELDVSIEYSRKKEYDKYTVYTIDFDSFVLYKTGGMMHLQLQSPYVLIDFHGHNKRRYYAVCYGNDDICSKFGGEIREPKEQHSSGTNVYLMTKI